MEVFGVLTLGDGRAALAADLAGTMVLGAVERDQHVATEQRRAAKPPFASSARTLERRMEQRRLDRIKHGADVVVARDVDHLEQRLVIRAALAFEQLALMGEKRRALHEEDREGPHPDVRHCELAVAPAPFVRQAGADAAHGRDERFKQFHAMVESVFSFPRNPPTAYGVNPPHPKPSRCQNQNCCDRHPFLVFTADS
jgi:hypothetical protein